MRRVRYVAVGVSLLLLGGATSWAESGAAPSAAATAGKAESTPAQGDAATSKVDVAALKTGIVGNWRSVDDGEVMAFAADGDARIKDPNATFTATYTVGDDGALHINVPVFAKGSDFTYKVEVKGDAMTLTLKDRPPRTYERIK